MFEIKMTIEIPGLPEALNALAGVIGKQPEFVCHQHGGNNHHIDNAGVVNVDFPAAPAPVAFPASAWPPVPPSCRTSGRCLSGCPLATARAARRMLAHTVGRCAVAPSCCCSFLQSSSGQWRDDADRVVVLVQND